MKKNLEFLSKALSLLPEVKETLVPPKEGQFFSKPLGKGDSVTIDFGKHLVGHLQVKMGYVNSHPDAPVWIRFSFAENLKEFEENVENYQGWICSCLLYTSCFCANTICIFAVSHKSSRASRSFVST